MFVVSFVNFKSCMLSRDPSGDHMMPCAEVHFIVQASQWKFYRFEPPYMCKLCVYHYLPVPH